MKFIAIALCTMTFALFQDVPGVHSLDLASLLREFGLPTVLCVLMWFGFRNQNERRIREQREFWADNNAYLRRLVDQGGQCKFKEQD